MYLNEIIFNIYKSHSTLNPSATDRYMRCLNVYMKKAFSDIKYAFTSSANIEELITLNEQVNVISFNIEKIYHILSTQQIEEYEIYTESVKRNISKKIDDILYHNFYQM